MTGICTGCGSSFDAAVLKELPTGHKFNPGTGYYCPVCVKWKDSKNKLIKVRNAYHKQRPLRAGHHRY
ncbi:hypothetical protein D8682_25115 [Buttiauxella sp. 3AFRM03]|nr:hypothetical protein D8682_25115 [Buttiauxella sp. 3AFRM03]